MYLEVIGDGQKVAKALGSNRPYKVGQLIRVGEASKMRTLARQNPDLFELHDDPLKQDKKLPAENKMMKTGRRSKMKGKRKSRNKAGL